MREVAVDKAALLAAKPTVTPLPDAHIPGGGTLQARWMVEIKAPVAWITTAINQAEGERLSYAWTRGVRDQLDNRSPRRFQTMAEAEAYQAGRAIAAEVMVR